MKAHTAVHIFARSLQNLGLQIFVRKAEEKEDEGIIYIQPKIDKNYLIKAENNVNQIIFKGLEVKEEQFESLKEAIEKYPNIRYNWQRLEENQKTRVIKIGDFDVAACAREHETNTFSLKFFTIKNVNYKGEETIIDFLVGENAIDFVLENKNKYLDLEYTLHTQDVIKNITNLKQENEKLKKENERLIKEVLLHTNKVIVENAMDYIKSIPEMIKNKDKIIIVGNNDIIIASKENNLIKESSLAKELGLKGIIKDNLIAGKLDPDKISKLLNLN
ncbi:MAG: hypothetical protein OH340_02505 [Candidatus Parvarchaeota archaeon]|nr:hypothetical protein [Candidatus Rehaiarchaeum fermentans]